MLRSKRSAGLAGSLLMLLLVIGCGGDDATAPATGGNTMQLDAEDAEEWMTMSLGLVNGVVSGVPAMFSGDLTVWNQSLAAKSGGEPVWDPADQAWTLEFSGPVMELEAPNHFLLSVDMWVQYTDGGVPVQSALAADAMEVALDYGIDMHQEDEQSSVDMDYGATMGMTVTHLGGGESFGVSGQGGMTVSVAASSPDGSESGTFGMEWTMDVVVDAGGCVEGTATVLSQGWTLAAVYDGQGGVSWTLSGPNYQASGTDEAPCGSVDPVY